MGLSDELGFKRPLENPPHEAILSIVLTGTLLSKEGTRILRPFKLTDSQFNVLMLLKHQSEDGRLSQTELGRMLLVNRSNVTGLVDRMEQAGWVRRRGDPGDRRINWIHITPEGLKLLERAEEAYLKRIHELMKSLQGKDETRLCRWLERIRAGIRAGRGS